MAFLDWYEKIMQWHLPFNKKDLEKAYEKGGLDTQVELSSSMVGCVISGKSIDTKTDEEMMEESKIKAKVFIPLNLGKVTVVDFCDYEKIKNIKWYVNHNGKNFYVERQIKINKKIKRYSLHRVIVNAKNNQEVDHRDGDALNNIRKNLRVCTHQENMRNQRVRINNTSGYRGVYYNKSHKKWRAQIQDRNGNRKYLGSFDTPEEAASVFDRAALSIYGKFCGELNYEKRK